MTKDWIYDKNKDNTARYTLAKVAETHLFCFGINPSTASPEKLDNTVSSVSRIARRHGFDEFFMFNIYPQRATDPNDMHNECDMNLHKENLKYIDLYFSKNKESVVLAAWGTLIHKRAYLKDCLLDIYEISKKHNIKWKCIGKISKDSHPHHPLYLSNAEMMKDFDIEKYLNGLK